MPDGQVVDVPVNLLAWPARDRILFLESVKLTLITDDLPSLQLRTVCFAQVAEMSRANALYLNKNLIFVFLK